MSMDKTEHKALEQPRRKAPELKITGEAEVSVSALEEGQLEHLYGTRTAEAANHLMISALNALGQDMTKYMDLMPAMAVEIEPQDAIEGMLVTQMTATHLAITEVSRRFHHASTSEVREACERSMTRLSRTFLSQMESLKRYRAKAQQIVRVERVEVNEGGRAVVGDVSYRRGEDD